ncbi:MAG: hypothetical protein NC936_05970, partial [Candidatus Omnitrophica bacterium]|nr:hypothetical protein [Candidatus Omnitrophota bacterium]
MRKLKRYLKNLISLGLLLNLSLCLSCAKNPPLSKQESPEEIFLKSFKGTLKYDIPLYANAKLTGKTLWIYIAQEKEILTIERTRRAQEPTLRTYLDIKGDFDAENFKFYYCIYKMPPLPPTQFKEEPYSWGVTEDFTFVAQEITNKIYSSLADLLYAGGSKDLKFFMVSIADIKKGIEVKTTINRADLEKYIVGIIPAEQFHTRTIVKIQGSEKIINDKKGTHLT